MEILRGKPIQGVASEVPNRIDRLRHASYLVQSEVAKDDTTRSHGWQDGLWIFPRAMRFLEVSEYRPEVLAGLLISIGSKTDSTVSE